MRTLIFVAIALAMASTSTAGQLGRVLFFVNGDQLLQNCQDRGPECVGYITGVADTLEMVAPSLTSICRPSTVEFEQIVDVLISWLTEHPAERHRPAAALAGLAFGEAWPCDK